MFAAGLEGSGVIGVSTFLSIQALHEEGVPKKGIARRLGVDVRTVRKWIARIERGDGHVQARQGSPGILAEHLETLKALVKRDCSAVQVHEALLKEDGFEASYATVRRMVAQLREKTPKVYCRLHFEPAEEGQIDFGYVGRMEHEGKLRKVWLFALTLCFSRYTYYELVLDQSVPTFLHAIRRGFEYFGGVPVRLKPDNLKAAVLLDQLGQSYYQEDFFRFCRHYGTLPDAARPRTPTDKGRVERSIGYAKGNFFRGREPTSFTQAQADLAAWRDGVANARLHATTQRRPKDMFEAERSTLKPLAAEPFEICFWGLYRVRKDCHVAMRGNFYSVPWKLAGERVLVRLAETEVTLFARGEEVARHERASGTGHSVTNPEHYPAEKRIATQEIHRRRVLLVRECGPYAAQYLGRLKASRYVRTTQLAQLSRLVVDHGAEAFEKACRRALHFDAFEGAATLQRILERGLHDHPLPPASTAKPASNGVCYARPAAEYDDVVAAVAS